MIKCGEIPERYAALLNSGRVSLIVEKGASVSEYSVPGVRQLYSLLTQDYDSLRDALVADKVVGKGAAALMILGGVAQLYTPLVSEGALALFAGSNVDVVYTRVVPHIINRDATGWCPVEKLCKDCTTALECLPLIENFMEKNTNNQNIDK